jgi:hypothetical protein
MGKHLELVRDRERVRMRRKRGERGVGKSAGTVFRGMRDGGAWSEEMMHWKDGAGEETEGATRRYFR